jgi:hypothetical protein
VTLLHGEGLHGDGCGHLFWIGLLLRGTTHRLATEFNFWGCSF